MEEIEGEKYCLKTGSSKTNRNWQCSELRRWKAFTGAKICIVHCQTKLQELKAKLVNSTEEKAELMEKTQKYNDALRDVLGGRHRILTGIQRRER